MGSHLNSNSGIIIIGSGLAGYTLAREFRKHNQQMPLTIITADDGSFYSKPQLSSALSHHKTAEQLATITAEKAQIQFNASIYTHSIVTEINSQQQTVTIAQKIITYDHLVIACGAVPVSPALTGDAVAEVHSINDLQDYRIFRQSLVDKKHIAIIGSGLVGCEFSNDLIKSNYNVSVIGSSSTPLHRLIPEELGAVFQKSMTANCIDWYLAQRVKEVNYQQNGYRLNFNNGTHFDADLVIRAVGLEPNIVIAQNAGIKCNKGIIVNRYLQTNIPNIYAIGDCAEVEGHVLLYLAPLVLCARALAKTLAGELTAVHYPAMPIFVKTASCPVVAALPATGLKGNWSFQISENQGTGLLYDDNQQLIGYALVGAATAQSSTLVKQLPPLLV
jgi:rubredoxin-NAD+ reductase